MTQYFRLSGGGNDFLALTGASSEPTGDEIRRLCRRGLSVGADGLFILQQQGDAILLRYFNADGRPAELCLNATRCAIRLAHHLGWASRATEIETGAGRFHGWLLGPGRVALDLPRPASPTICRLSLGESTYEGWRVEVGVPHFVLAWPGSLAEAPVAELGNRLRHHPAWGKRGSNINFVRFVDRHRLEIRTFERGVERETLACGTGVMASTAAGVASGALALPVGALTLGGFEFRVEAGRDGSEETWSLAGDARLIAEGDLHAEALALCSSPAWTP